MVIDGYDDDCVVAGEELLGLPGFWAASLLMACGEDDERGEPSPDWFGADPADVDAACEALSDAERWPAFRIPFADGHTAVVLHQNFEDDPGTEYVVVHPEWGRPGFLATIDGHDSGPGLAWRELLHIAHTPVTDAPGIHDVHARLLLLLPALGDADLPDDAAAVVAEALISAGVPAENTAWLAAHLLDHSWFAPATWAFPGASPLTGGAEPYEGILVCDGRLSPRRATRLAQGISREHSDRLARALGTWAAA
ncbi:hypothetical protein OIB37_02390 [Streptomyces sp. NBC_00820]|uniref:hypothetical protein n=1 Tax=Streptomyces sp. NBC_00820 TaxID=2975842 RepID=UPI002ED1426E|nr:hypothetical protein OIB37_02390 [Streptomyces sp. NBC_00820]